MFSYEEWHDNGKRKSRCQIGRDALAAQATFKTVDVDNPCAILLKGVEQTQGDASITRQVVEAQAARDAALLKAAQESLWEALRAAGVLRPPE